jgi:DNA damage-binding protein 1
MAFTEVTAWGRVDAQRYLLSDFRGALSMLVLQCEASQVVGLHLEPLGNSCVADTINYLDRGVVYLGSSVGDSTLVRLNARRGSSGGFLEVLDAFPSLGPILDMCIVDRDRQGQVSLFECLSLFKFVIVFMPGPSSHVLRLLQ